MPVSAEIYIVISLMFAVFAAVAAVGSSVVLGVGFERLRAGFEVIKKQTGFFADAIHKLDERTSELREQNVEIKSAMASVVGRVDKVEKQTGFFFESLNTMEEKILQGSPAKKDKYLSTPAPLSDEIQEKKKSNKLVLPQVMAWKATTETRHLLQANQDSKEERPSLRGETYSGGLSSMFWNYLRSDNRSEDRQEIVYH